jgi:serine/threonine protein kinase
VLGRGAQGQTWLATAPNGTQVAIKHLSMSGAHDWKALELFEREGRALKNLSHPGIPTYIDALHTDEDDFFLIQEYVEGPTLQQLIERGALFTESQVHDLLIELLDILIYLGNFSPPLIHRDIKPNNLIQRHDGRLALIDFGGVLTDAQDATGGSTVVGTTGYMPPEQLVGRASPSSDLYALGATAIHLLSKKPPSQLPMNRMKLQFRDVVSVSEAMCAFLERLVEPAMEDRFERAQDAKDALLKP